MFETTNQRNTEIPSGWWLIMVNHVVKSVVNDGESLVTVIMAAWWYTYPSEK